MIVGGGLAGLTAARLLHAKGIDFVLLEARDRLGGRILSVDASGEPSADGFDLGPSWFWPGMHAGFGAFVDELGLGSFGQHDEGEIVFERSPHEARRRFRGMRQEPQSMRLTGGTASIVRTLEAGLPSSRVSLRTRVRAIEAAGPEIVLTVENADGREARLEASHVILALPPRLLEATVAFSPTLDPGTARRWRETPTWMAPHAKFVAVYDRAFWRDDGLSGTAQSMVGPLGEIHDATSASGAAALFGFLGVAADARVAAGDEAIVAACLRQLVRLFGPEAATPRATVLKDWAADPLTATAADRIPGGHPVPDRRPWVAGTWEDRISLAGSETSASDPGYLAGAVDAAERAVAELFHRHPSLRATGAQAC
ncbi:FAD-dependent oxidoreductase [Aureimonas sp. ME7]|uniref:flavin monoamine oxidase family protein n=1 Tax=Aureimonas sp. ME7 TaxID=2744252 RepID=UPI001FCF1573|nr:FAD-dependent oxidoreductase [Aureimonas sp. ME7]